jgi:cobalamin biosynthesis Mg chelatase CobN
MIGTRRLPAPVGGRHILAVSVLALLALACLPVLAQADSSGIQYNPSVPSATHKSEIPSQNGGVPAHSSDTPGGKSGSDGSTAPDSSEADSSQESDSSKEDAALAKNDDGGGNGGNGQGNPDKSSGHERDSAANPLGSQTTEQDSDSGSSPLVPILIAVAVLAAISVAVVAFRQRRRRSGSDAQVSPEVG